MTEAAGDPSQRHRGPLDGIRVIDLSHYAAGPIATMVLGDLGAEVIKIEHPNGDAGRTMGATFPEGWSTFFLAISRNKRFISIDYRTPAGQQLIQDLVRNADVLVENARPGAWDDYGLDYATLSAINPRLVYASLSGFGDAGPMRDWLSMDLIAQAVGGIVGITGSEEGGPARVGAAIVDTTAGRLAAFGIVTALYERDQRSGLGQHVQTSLFSTAVAMMQMREVEYQFVRENPKLTGTAHGQITPAQAFETRDGRRVMLCIYHDPHFSRWAKAAGHEEILEDERFQSNVARHSNQKATAEAVGRIMLERSEEEWTELLAGIVPYGPVLEFDQLWDHPQLEASQLMLPYEMPGLGQINAIGSPVQFSAYTPRVRRVPQKLGTDTHEVLTDFGLDTDVIAQLAREGVIVVADDAALAAPPISTPGKETL